MFITVWKFVVRPEAVPEFERRYGSEGTWTSLFRKAHGYLGTELYRSIANASEYVTIDRWIDDAAYRAFRDEYAAEYDAIDRECEELTEVEEKLA